MTFELLQKPVGTLDLILHLLRHGKASVMAIISDTGMNKESFYGAADRLKTLGFAYEDKQTGYPTYVYWGLTRAGEAFARALGPAAELISRTAAALERELADLEEAADPATTPRRLDILALLTDREFALGRWDSAEGYAQRLVDLARAGNDAPREIRGRLGLGRVYQKRDRHDDARRELDEALRLATGARLAAPASEIEYAIGADLERQGRWAESVGRFEAAIRAAREAHDLVQAARARQATARILARQGRLEESLALLREVSGDLEQANEEDELPRVYVALGNSAYSLARLDEAGTWYEKAVEAAQRVGDLRMEAFGLANAAARWIELGDFRRADAALKRSGRVFEDLGERTGIGLVELNTAALLSAQGRWSEAEAGFDRALVLTREIGNRFQEGWVLFKRGMMMKRRERPGEARPLLTAARGIFADLGSEARVRRCDEELRDLTGS